MSSAEYRAVLGRLDRIERALAKSSYLDDLINPVDPPPYDLGRDRFDLARIVRLLEGLHWKLPVPIPIPEPGDPAPFDRARFAGASTLESRLAELIRRIPGWVSDPSPDDFLNIRLIDLIRQFRGGFTDPAPEDLSNVRLRDLLQKIPGGGVTDPSPEDVWRLTRPEVEAQLHKLRGEMKRLQSLEGMLVERAGQLKGATEGG